MRWSVALLLTLGCSDYEIVPYDGTDVFYQDPASEVDILLIVDNSGSMAPYQQQLSQNFSEFISFFTAANVDYRIGVTTTDTAAQNAGQLRGDIITNDTPDAEGAFQELVSVGVQGSGYEMGLLASSMALTEPLLSGANAGFIRETASLSILYVTDEEDSSPAPPDQYANQFLRLKGLDQRGAFNASALVVLDPGTCSLQAQQFSTRGDRYIRMAEETGGIIGDICAESFADIVTELSLNASRLMDTFYLSDEPNLSTLEVSVNGEILSCESGQWTYDRVEDRGELRPAVIFARDSIPPPSSQIAIQYMHGSGDPAGFCADGESTTDDSGSDT